MNKRILYPTLIILIAVALFLGSGYRIPRSVTDGVQSVLPRQSVAPTSPDRIPRNPRGDICQLGESCRPNEVQRAPLGGGE
jgi:hypothetical protein